MPLLDTFKSFIQSPTESKVKQATNEDETSGATGTLMNEISILTYSPKTVREIIQVIRKRLLLGQNRRNSHRNCIQVMKTLTLVSYLMNNGSNEFIKWLKGNMILIEILEDFQVQDSRDERKAEDIQKLSRNVLGLLQDDGLLEKQRKDVIQFRSSISTPGRKSTDNSHLKLEEMRNELTRQSLEKKAKPPTTSTSLDFQRQRTRNTHEYARFSLDPLAEEDSEDTPGVAGGISKLSFRPKSSNNPFR
ncbi:CQS_1a_G0033730.mRNA.1.CDS.1 [Saccharomyces cerevisiae]|nr:CQS_1a_G0033730.mRNA.1.CDS.1 [Saccharomyces cerevisiae]CAI7391926.1 CQS_1a_G0033730.mRNA.1.CDS.1 [Saccharomyces cerevisiae]